MRRGRASRNRAFPGLVLWLLLCQVEVAVRGVAGDGRAGGRDDGRVPWGVAGWRLQEPVDGADEVALEGSEGFAAGLAFGLFAIEERLGRGVVACFVEREAVERAVELAVAAGVQAVAVGASGGCGDRGGSGQPRELGVAGEASDAGDMADQLGRGQRPAAASSPLSTLPAPFDASSKGSSPLSSSACPTVAWKGSTARSA